MEFLYALIIFFLILSSGVYLLTSIIFYRLRTNSFREAFRALRQSSDFPFFVGIMMFFCMSFSMLVADVIQVLKEI